MAEWPADGCADFLVSCGLSLNGIFRTLLSVWSNDSDSGPRDRRLEMGGGLLLLHDDLGVDYGCGRLSNRYKNLMSMDWLIIGAIVGSAAGWLIARAIKGFQARRKGGCAGGCGCADKIQPPKK